MRDVLDIDKPDVYDPAAAHGFPSSRQPCLLDVTIDKDVQMRLAVFVKLQNGYVFGSVAILPTQVGPELIKRLPEIYNRITFDFARVQGERDESV